MTRQEVEKLIGRLVHVHAPAEPGACEWLAHGEVVVLKCFSPTQREVVRTSAGPLQFTRKQLVLTLPWYHYGPSPHRR